MKKALTALFITEKQVFLGILSNILIIWSGFIKGKLQKGDYISYVRES